MTKDTSIVLFAHGGRCAQVGAQFCPPGELGEVKMAEAVLDSTLFTLFIDESATRLRIVGSLTGLPKVRDIIEMMPNVMVHDSTQKEGAPYVRLSSSTCDEVTDQVRLVQELRPIVASGSNQRSAPPGRHRTRVPVGPGPARERSWRSASRFLREGAYRTAGRQLGRPRRLRRYHPGCPKSDARWTR